MKGSAFKLYTLILRNIKTNETASVKVFEAFEVGCRVGWGTDDGEEIAQWEVLSCTKDQANI